MKKNNQYKKEYTVIHDDKRCSIKLGQVVKFNCREDYFPKYAMNQYGRVVKRVRVTTYKLFAGYRDYYLHIVMLSGRGKGKIRIYSSGKIAYLQKIDEENWKRIKDEII